MGGVDYPRTLQEFDEWFSNEAACVEYLRRLRWPEGFRGLGCGGSEAWLTSRVFIVKPFSHRLATRPMS
jgi:hypothetical protein